MQDPPGVRIAGLPGSTLSRLRARSTHSLLVAAVDEEAALRDLGARLSDELYAVIGALDPEAHDRDRTTKPALVGLRRAVHQQRPPTDREWNPDIAAVLPSDLRRDVTRWAERLRHHRQRLESAHHLLATETDAVQQRLRELTAHPHFLRGLAVSSPSLFAALRKWHADPRRRPRRQSIGRLVKYVTRAAAKTSPYSTFTIIGLGRWSTLPTTRLHPDAEVRCLLEPGRLGFERVRDALAADARTRHALRVRVNPSAAVRDGKVRFLAPSRAEPIVTLPHSATMDEVLRTVSDADSPTLGELCEVLARTHGNPEAVGGYVDRLVTAGLLETQVPSPDQSIAPFAELADWLDSAAVDDATSTETSEGTNAAFGECATLARALARELDAASTPRQPEQQLARDQAVRHTSRALFAAVGDLTERETARESDRELPEELEAHENGLYVGTPVECSLPEWRPALRDLDVVRRWLAIQDPVTPLRLVLGTLLRERFGAGVRLPVVDLQRLIHEEIGGDGPYGSELSGAMDRAFTNPLVRQPSDLDRVRELYRLQADAEHELVATEPVDGEIRVDPARITAVTESWPDWLEPPTSVTCFVQQVPLSGQVSLAGQAPPPGRVQPSGGDVAEDGRVGLMLNGATVGFGRGRNRIHHQVERVGGRPEPLGVTRTEDGVVTVELAGAFGSGLNHKHPTADYELDYPGVVTDRPVDQRLALHDLVVTLDPERDLPRLESRSLSTRVRPLHLGTMADPLLPPVARLITQVFGGGYLKHPAMALLDSLGDTGLPDGIVYQPRVRLGHVVLRRASWLVPAGSAPTGRPTDRPADYPYRLLGWLRDHGIPDLCFVRALGAALFDPEAAADTLPYWAFRKARKPLVVDAANVYLVDLFERLATDPDTAVLLIEEALPDPTDALRDADGETWATEFQIELSGRPA